ncbi:hypothetical protein IAG44_28620 [Streptomyces roseirectus]|uniref:Uncharacterized protein n=1 Tax=Streptomyces roseirectus TaxID=2768066 RepID=A0A7H0IJP2_9ACTN|nr:hypothetical protein [Streptomyces roseirectus]QNP73008.1 hypothetical protein IAG44_28620 [Streptomyces roseirectus]
MSDAITTQPPSADTQAREVTGHGRHRGPQADHDSHTAPHGRHRRPAEESESAAA